MPKKDSKSIIGAWAFLIGVILALIFGLFDLNAETWIPTLLVILGLVVGLLNVAVKEAKTFLFAAVSLVVVSYMGSSLLVTPWLSNILTSLLILFVPATVVVALRAVFSVSKG